MLYWGDFGGAVCFHYDWGPPPAFSGWGPGFWTLCDMQKSPHHEECPICPLTSERSTRHLSRGKNTCLCLSKSPSLANKYRAFLYEYSEFRHTLKLPEIQLPCKLREDCSLSCSEPYPELSPFRKITYLMSTLLMVFELPT